MKHTCLTIHRYLGLHLLFECDIMNKIKKMINNGETCKYPGCTFHAYAKGYCTNHYSLMRYRERKEKEK